MVATVSGRLKTAVAALAGAFLSLVSTGAAHAAPPPPPPSISISGEGLAKPIMLRGDGKNELYTGLMEQVSWLSGAGQTTAPQAENLGPKYTVVVLAGNVAKQTYDLYPLAKGGPRACRPAKQPDRSKSTTKPAWFYGRLSMADSLRAAGVPLPLGSNTLSGGAGGGDRAVPDPNLNPTKDLDHILGDLRQLLLLNAGVIVVITVGLAGISLLVRRRTR